jgi:hypothetical protein
MDSLSIVKDLNPFGNDRPGNRSYGEDSGVNQLRFKSAEKAFSYCIVPTIHSTTHTKSYAAMAMLPMIDLRLKKRHGSRVRVTAPSHPSQWAHPKYQVLSRPNC